ncbi:MAG: hypothetical protein LJF30_13470 [Acidobacteria bacterium]|nr:hypothetical protein [Acidobacteriota bacterium]
MGTTDGDNQPPPDCRRCGLFRDEPERLERALPGLTILSSASGSTRGLAGICLARHTFQDPEPACSEFRPRPD